MASRTITQLVSDLSGDDIQDGRGESIDFAYRGTSYTIDLTDKEAAGFDKSVAVYIDHATKTGGRRRSRAASGSSDHSAKEVRAWAKAQGLHVPERGRIPAAVLAEYRAAN